MREQREIKFRAWVTDHWTKKSFMFYQGDQYLQSFLRRCVFSSSDGREHEKYGNYKLMQSTGFKLKEKELYEGDILKFEMKDLEPEYGVIRFSKDGFWTSQKEGMYEELLCEELTANCYKISIAGNIYSNPELI